jgi:hypothetical protein
MAAVHFEEPTSKWLRVYMKKFPNPTWIQFVQAIEEKIWEG